MQIPKIMLASLTKRSLFNVIKLLIRQKRIGKQKHNKHRTNLNHSNNTVVLC